MNEELLEEMHKLQAKRHLVALTFFIEMGSLLQALERHGQAPVLRSGFVRYLRDDEGKAGYSQEQKRK